MDNNKDNLESFFKDNLSSFEASPSDDMWGRIEGNIPTKTALVTGKSVALALAAVLVLAVIVFLVNANYELEEEVNVLQHTVAQQEDKLNQQQEQLTNFITPPPPKANANAEHKDSPKPSKSSSNELSKEKTAIIYQKPSKTIVPELNQTNNKVTPSKNTTTSSVTSGNTIEDYVLNNTLIKLQPSTPEPLDIPTGALETSLPLLPENYSLTKNRFPRFSMEGSFEPLFWNHQQFFPNSNASRGSFVNSFYAGVIANLELNARWMIQLGFRAKRLHMQGQFSHEAIWCYCCGEEGHGCDKCPKKYSISRDK